MTFRNALVASLVVLATGSFARASEARFLETLRTSPGKVVLASGNDPQTISSIEVARTWQDAICRSTLTNRGKEAVRVREVVLFDVRHDLAGNTPLYAESFQMLSQTGGTLAEPRDLGSFTDRQHYRIPEPPGFRSVYGMMLLSPPGQPRMMLGFASCRRFAGRFDLAPRRVRVVIDTENLAIQPGQAWQLEDFLVAADADREKLLEQLASAIEKNHPRLKHDPVPTGWCSWYCFGSNVTAKNVYANLDFIAAQAPQLKYIQIDDGYQTHMGDWTDTGSSFGGGIQQVLKDIRARGFEPAIWVAPFIADGQSRVFREHPDWFIQGSDGRPLKSDTVTFGGWRSAPWYCLDGTHPAVQKHLETLFRFMRQEWGCTYFKLDANFWGAIHGGRLHDPKATRVEAYRRGMEAIQRGSGDAFILGCNHPVWPSLGLIHGSRSSMDVSSASWDWFKSTGRENLYRAWQNGRLWWNDPDCVLLTGKLSDNEFAFHATLIYATGGMLLSGDDLSALPPSRLAILRKLVPPTGVPARFENDRFELGRIRLLNREMVAVFNWDDTPAARAVPVAAPSRIVDYWTGEDLGSHDGSYRLPDLPPHSARLLVVTPSR